MADTKKKQRGKMSVPARDESYRRTRDRKLARHFKNLTREGVVNLDGVAIDLTRQHNLPNARREMDEYRRQVSLNKGDR